MHDVVAKRLGLVKANYHISTRKEQTGTRLVSAQNTKYEAPHNGKSKFTVRNLTRAQLSNAKRQSLCERVWALVRVSMKCRL